MWCERLFFIQSALLINEYSPQACILFIMPLSEKLRFKGLPYLIIYPEATFHVLSLSSIFGWKQIIYPEILPGPAGGRAIYVRVYSDVLADAHLRPTPHYLRFTE